MSSRRGFTLLELTIAAALIALMGAATVTVFSRGMNSWQRAQNRLERARQIEKVMDELSGELKNSVVLSGSPFTGTAEELIFLTAYQPTALRSIHYHLKPAASDNSWIKESRSFPLNEQEEAQAAVLLRGVKGIQIEYAVVDSESGGPGNVQWHTQWDAVQFPDDGPKILRIKLQLADWREGIFSFSREFWIPAGSFGGALE